MESILYQLFIFLAASAIAVPLTKRVGLGSVTGYLLAGIIIGPFGLSLINDIEHVMHFTEFGVVMMLFLVGLELKPSELWERRNQIAGMGGIQVILTTLVILALLTIFIPWREALAIALILSLSSTAQIIQTLKEKGLSSSTSGEQVLSITIFHDIAVIPIMAILPILSHRGHGHIDNYGSHAESIFFDISSLHSGLQILVTIGALIAVYFLAKFIAGPMFRAVAATKVREIFVAATLALIIGISLIMYIVNLSPALGTFIAGVVLADSEYRHELESDIDPFKGLLLGIFFISIGASLNFNMIKENHLIVLALVAALILIKWLTGYITGKVFRIQQSERTFFATSLAQGGAFAFVLLPIALNSGVLESGTAQMVTLIVILSMLITPLLFNIHEYLTKRVDDLKKQSRQSDEIEVDGRKVIMAGFGKLGVDLGRFIISAGIKPVIIDHDINNVNLLRKFGFQVFYGDITRPDLLEAAGAEEAELLIVTIKDTEKSMKLIEHVKNNYPKLKIAVNASDRGSTYELMDYEPDVIRRESFGTALELGRNSLELLGYHPYEAYRLMRLFRKKDEEMLPKLRSIHQQDKEGYISEYQSHLRDIEGIMAMDQASESLEVDRAWSAKNPEL